MTIDDYNYINPQALLQQIWGYSAFRYPQAEIIRSLMAQQDTIAILPTGGGKSICFQLPALTQPGLTIVISPLVALMENQVQELQALQIPAALLHSELQDAQRKQILAHLTAQKLKLLYLSPETLFSPSIWQRLCQRDLRINHLVIDEAHCLAQWGETFRPTYYRLGAARSQLLRHKPSGSRIAIAAFTATADPATQQTVERILNLDNPQCFRLNPYRPNLTLQVQSVLTPRGQRQRLLAFIQSQGKQAGLVYVRTRAKSEELAQGLTQQGYSVAAYHAGMIARDRRRIEQAWLSDRLQFVVCTNAFGMGINKPNLRWMVHYHAPLLLSEYVQEIGRAGRDGKAATALALVSEPTGWLNSEDRERQRFFQTQERKLRQKAQQLLKQLPQQGDLQTIRRQFKQAEIALSLLHGAGVLEWQDPFHYVIHQHTIRFPSTQDQAVNAMVRYLYTSGCRWKFLLEAFGFTGELKAGCGHCDRCQSTHSQRHHQRSAPSLKST